MRNISFFLTQDQFKDRSKDVTRRLGWKFLKAGDVLMACEKCQGLKPGEPLNRLGVIKVVDVRREPLHRMIVDQVYGVEEARREGFPKMNGEQFVEMFCEHMKGEVDQVVTRIEFKYL